MASTEPIDHQPGRFELKVDGRICELEYLLRDGALHFVHTGVPPELQGRGLAARLVETGLQWAHTQQYRVVPACSYVARYIERHPQWKALLKD